MLAIGVQHSRHNAVAVIDGLNPLRKVVVLFDVPSLKRSAVFLQASNEVLAERAPGRSVNGHVFGGLWSLHISHTQSNARTKADIPLCNTSAGQ